MKLITLRKWLLASWLFCLFFSWLMIQIVEGVQHALALTLPRATWILGASVAGLLAASFALLGIGWLLGQWVLKPLAAMQQAAQQIAQGDIHFSLPPSRLAEVNDVAAAFTAMGNGLRTAIESQAHLEAERRLWISAVAHDLRTPLFALRGYLDGLAQGVASTPEKQAHYLEVCRQQATVLDQRVNALFAFARLDYLEQPLHLQTVDWQALVNETIVRIQPAANLKTVTVQTLPAQEALTLAGDPQLLLRMLENLLDNAVCHTPVGSHVTIGWQAEGDYLAFQVTDEGAGIAPEAVSQIFLPRYRTAQVDHQPSGGAGLGLIIAQRIAQAHGGTLQAANRAQGGAAFSGRLAKLSSHPI